MPPCVLCQRRQFYHAQSHTLHSASFLGGLSFHSQSLDLWRRDAKLFTARTRNLTSHSRYLAGGSRLIAWSACHLQHRKTRPTGDGVTGDALDSTGVRRGARLPCSRSGTSFTFCRTSGSTIHTRCISAAPVLAV
ncbi:hypothetical protein E2C01_054189 [Portunus trituberculatus]|uniref:Uncharacterized protein n=1 Tax=Portunus trituberculatus TaxID=210409 RepID=A0A5B7GML5_PORTR|nr:hypothetical protein [Portunus trituberculatus]